MQLDQQHSITTPRGRFHLRTTGDDGSPVVMLHGWPESSHCWIPVAKRLPAGFRIIAPDLRGLGDSERTLELSAYRKQALAQDVLALLDAMGIKQFHLVGHDWGGVVAQEIALAAPQRVQRLCLMNIVVINNHKGSQEARQKAFGSGNFWAWYQHFQMMPGLAERMIPGNEETWLGCFFGSGWPDDSTRTEALREYARCYRIPGTPATGANYYRSMGDDAQSWATLAGTKFAMPALYVYGNQDPVIIPEYLNHIEDAFDSIEVRQIDAGHFVQEEQPELVAKYLGDFLAAGE